MVAARGLSVLSGPVQTRAQLAVLGAYASERALCSSPLESPRGPVLGTARAPHSHAGTAPGEHEPGAQSCGPSEGWSRCQTRAGEWLGAGANVEGLLSCSKCPDTQPQAHRTVGTHSSTWGLPS